MQTSITSKLVGNVFFPPIVALTIMSQPVLLVPTRTYQPSKKFEYSISEQLDKSYPTSCYDFSYLKTKNQFDTIYTFAENFIQQLEDIPPEFSEAISENIWDLV